MSEFNKLTVEFVEWIDSMNAPRWQTHQQMETWSQSHDDLRCESVGFLAHEDEQVIILVQSVNEHQVADAVKIPKCAIKARKELRGKDGNSPV